MSRGKSEEIAVGRIIVLNPPVGFISAPARRGEGVIIVEGFLDVLSILPAPIGVGIGDEGVLVIAVEGVVHVCHYTLVGVECQGESQKRVGM